MDKKMQCAFGRGAAGIRIRCNPRNCPTGTRGGPGCGAAPYRFSGDNADARQGPQSCAALGYWVFQRLCGD